MDDAGGLQLDEDGIIENDFPDYFNSIDQFYRANDFYTQYISVTNRTENSNALISFQNLSQDGILSLDFFGYQRQNFRVNYDLYISDKLKLSTSNLLSASEGIEPNVGPGNPFFDRRRTDDLGNKQFRHFPIPARNLNAWEVPLYTTGGE